MKTMTAKRAEKIKSIVAQSESAFAKIAGTCSVYVTLDDATYRVADHTKRQILYGVESQSVSDSIRDLADEFYISAQKHKSCADMFVAYELYIMIKDFSEAQAAKSEAIRLAKSCLVAA